MLALLSGFAPRGMAVVPTDDVQSATEYFSYGGDDEAVIHQPAPHHSQLPEFPAEVEEEEVRESEVTKAHGVVAVRKESFLAHFLVTGTWFAAPPSPVQRARVLLPPGTGLTVLYRVFRI
ncbi:MAG: hypothetical protein WA952_05415 [Lewinella sp.]